MDELKQSVQNAVYEQKDPLLIYKFESFELFKGMVDKVNKDVISFLFKGKLPVQEQPENIKEAKDLPRKKEKLQTSRESDLPDNQATPNQTQAPQAQETYVRTDKKIGRNDKVTIKNVMSGESKSMKYKQAIPLIDKGQWVLVDED